MRTKKPEGACDDAIGPPDSESFCLPHTVSVPQHSPGSSRSGAPWVPIATRVSDTLKECHKARCIPRISRWCDSDQSQRYRRASRKRHARSKMAVVAGKKMVTLVTTQALLSKPAVAHQRRRPWAVVCHTCGVRVFAIPLLCCVSSIERTMTIERTISTGQLLIERSLSDQQSQWGGLVGGLNFEVVRIPTLIGTGGQATHATRALCLDNARARLGGCDFPQFKK